MNGSEPLLLQDCDKKLSKWLANTPHARQYVIEECSAITQRQDNPVPIIKGTHSQLTEGNTK
jgi:hypothetical protein